MINAGVTEYDQYELGNIINHSISEIIEALMACRVLNYRHPDLKPANIMINHKGQLKLRDFEKTAGTLLYWPPKKFLQAATDDAKSDVWTLGIILIELFYGENPIAVFKGRNTIADFQELKQIM